MPGSDSPFPISEQGGDVARVTALTAVVLAWAGLAFPWLSGRFSVPWDAKAQFLPQVQFMAASWARGESAFWSPNVFSGHPQVADPQSMIFQPPYALLAWFNAAPTGLAADATLFCSILVGAVAMLMWLLDRRLHPAAAVVGAISFAFGAAMAWRIQHVGQVLSLAYLPLVLLLLDRALCRHSLGYGIAAGIAAAFLVFGRDQVGLLCVYLLVAYVVAHLVIGATSTGERLAAMKPLAGAALTGGAIVAIPILLTLLIAGESNRPSIDFIGAGRGSLHPALGLTFFAPDVFGSSGAMGEYWGPPSMAWPGTDLFLAQNMGQLYSGALPAVLVLYGLFSRALFATGARFFTIALAVTLIYAVGWYTPGFWVMHKLVPGVDLYRRPADAVFLIGFLTSVLGAYAFHRLLIERAIVRGPGIATIVVIVTVFAAMTLLAMGFGRLEQVWPAVVIPVALFALSGAVLFYVVRATTMTPSAVVAITAAVLTADLAYSNGPGGATALPPQTFEVLEPASQSDTIAQLKTLTRQGASGVRRDRIELVGFGFHWPNASLTHGLENTLGYNPLRLGIYTEATGAGDTVGLPDQRGFSPLFPSYRSTLANLLGLRYVASSVPLEQVDKALAGKPLPVVARTKDGTIYENVDALPRVLFVTAAKRADFSAILKTGDWGAFDPRAEVLLESDVETTPLRRAGVATITDYQNTSVVIATDSPDGGYVLLNDLFHAWWTATVDGGPATVLRANVLFRAVAVPPGRHTVAFTFAPLRGALSQLGSHQISRGN